ncbi:MAG: tRNA lysidine(34) synthetase TilS [Frankiaceae bacterium]
MARVPPAVAAIRVAVRGALADLPQGSVVLVACSGGADSLALAAGLAFVAPRNGWRGGAVVVDHGWTADTAQRSASVCATCRGLGLLPVEGLTARAPRREGPARDARRQALMQAAVRLGAAAVLLGHTRDDQAETVLMRLARGAGARSLAGMAARSGLFRRPLLGLSGSLTREACRVSGLSAWADPANADPAFARARVRHDALPALVAALGTGVPLGLARSADLLRLDNQALDELAEQALRSAADGPDLRVDRLGALAPAIRLRVLRRVAIDTGVPAGALSAHHLRAVDALVSRWRGQGPVSLPDGWEASRRDGRIRLVHRPGSPAPA